TGEHDALGSFRTYGGDTEVRTLDPSIQPGDGGVGLALSLSGFRALGPVSLYASGTYLLSPRNTSGVPTSRSRPSEAFLSVPDQYIARAGGFVRVPRLELLSLGLGARVEGTPVEDLIGGSEGFRRPGYSLAVEPAVQLAGAGWAVSASLPIAVRRNRKASVPDRMDRTHGDAAFASYAVIVGLSYRIGGGAGRAARPAGGEDECEGEGGGDGGRVVGAAAPVRLADAELTTLDGRPVRLQREITGRRFTVVNLWAFWCAPCRQEMSELVAMAPEIAARGRALVGVSVDQDAAAARAFAAEHGMRLSLYLGGPDLPAAVGEHAVPTTLVLDRQGDVLVRLRGAVTRERLRAALDAALGPPRAATRPAPVATR